MSEALSIIKDGLNRDGNNNFLVLVLFIIFSCLWGSHYLLSEAIQENKIQTKENAKQIQSIRETLAERKAYIYKNVSDKNAAGND